MHAQTRNGPAALCAVFAAVVLATGATWTTVPVVVVVLRSLHRTVRPTWELTPA